MDLHVLGPIEATVDDQPVAIGAGKPRALLAMLALSEGTAVSSEALIDGLWGEAPPATANKMVQVYVSQLRKALRASGNGAAIVTRGHGYELRLGDGEVDAHRFERLVADGAPREALALWRGPALDDVAAEPFASLEIRRLEELRLDAIELALQQDLEAGRAAEMVRETQTLIAQEPLRERLHGLRMLALYRLGRQAEALGAYRRARPARAGDGAAAGARVDHAAARPRRGARHASQAMAPRPGGRRRRGAAGRRVGERQDAPHRRARRRRPRRRRPRPLRVRRRLARGGAPRDRAGARRPPPDAARGGRRRSRAARGDRRARARRGREAPTARARHRDRARRRDDDARPARRRRCGGDRGHVPPRPTARPARCRQRRPARTRPPLRPRLAARRGSAPARRQRRPRRQRARAAASGGGRPRRLGGRAAGGQRAGARPSRRRLPV